MPPTPPLRLYIKTCIIANARFQTWKSWKSDSACYQQLKSEARLSRKRRSLDGGYA